MSKIICDVCGTRYPESSNQCPICGCVHDAEQDIAEMVAPEEEIVNLPTLRPGVDVFPRPMSANATRISCPTMRRKLPYP